MELDDNGSWIHINSDLSKALEQVEHLRAVATELARIVFYADCSECRKKLSLKNDCIDAHHVEALEALAATRAAFVPAANASGGRWRVIFDAEPDENEEPDENAELRAALAEAELREQLAAMTEAAGNATDERDACEERAEKAEAEVERLRKALGEPSPVARVEGVRRAVENAWLAGNARDHDHTLMDVGRAMRRDVDAIMARLKETE